MSLNAFLFQLKEFSSIVDAKIMIIGKVEAMIPDIPAMRISFWTFVLIFKFTFLVEADFQSLWNFQEYSLFIFSNSSTNVCSDCAPVILYLPFTMNVGTPLISSFLASAQLSEKLF